MKHIVHSCSNPGDVSLGHKRVKEYLQDHYSTVKDKTYPGMMFAKDGCKGDGGPIQHAWNYMWKEGTDKPQEDYKDFCDCFRYAALEQPVYRRPEPEINESYARMLIERENNKPQPSVIHYGLSIR
jgi:hypothetical protein